MNHTKRLKRFFCCVFLLSVIGQSTVHAIYTPQPQMIESTQDMHTIAGAVVGALCAASGVYLLGYCFGWWGYESHERLIECGNQKLQELGQYWSMTNIIRTSEMQFDPHRTFNEPLLYQLAFTKRASDSVDKYIMTLKNQMYYARDVCSRIEKRSLKLKNKSDWHEVRETCYALDEVSNKLYRSIKDLDVLVAHIDTHMSYFKLFECEDYVRNYYAQELALLDQYTDPYTIREGVRVAAFSKFSGPFALIAFVNSLKGHITCLEDLVLRSAYNYATRIAYARDLVARLQRIERIVISDNEYAHVVLEYQREQREKEMLSLEKERIRIEKRKVHAHERVAAAHETQNVLKAVEIANKQQQIHAY